MALTRAMTFVAVTAVAVAGCTAGSSSPPEPSSSPRAPTSSTTTSPTSTSSTTRPKSPPATAPAGFTLQEQASPSFPTGAVDGGPGSYARVRVGHHSSFDRVVWEFPGTGGVTYRVQYVDRPVADPSDEPVPVRGKAYIEVVVVGVEMPTGDAPRPPEAPQHDLAGTVLAQAGAIYGGFEGHAQTFVGVRDHRRPLRVSTLSQPTRLVVDILNR